MTDDRLEKVRAEVERLRNDWPKVISDGEKNHLWMYFRGLNRIRDFIDSMHRTPADIEAAMQEVEAKSEAYTNAHRGERADDVLSQMRGEPVSEDLDKEIDRYFNTEGIPVTEGALRDTARYFAEWQRDQILNCNATLLRTFELGKIEMKHQILKTMDLGEPPYLISVEKAYYDVKKLLEG